MLKIEELNQYYGESHTLWDIDLEVSAGRCVCILGRNGVGKTTLLKAIMGLLQPSGGRILFEGRSMRGMAAARRARAGIGYVPQGREIFAQLTVEENLRVALFARSDGRREIPDEVFELFPVLKKMLKRRGGDLSGGQQQQLAIGRALVLNPRMLILDEPTEGIQPNIIQEIGEIITRLNQERKMTVLLVEQKINFTRKVAESFLIMDKGRIVAQGQMPELDETLVNRFLMV